MYILLALCIQNTKSSQHTVKSTNTNHLRVKRIASNCKENPQLWSKFAIVSIFIALNTFKNVIKLFGNQIKKIFRVRRWFVLPSNDLCLPIWRYTVSWSYVDTPYPIPTPFKGINNKKDGFADRKNIFSLTAKQSLNQWFLPSLNSYH